MEKIMSVIMGLLTLFAMSINGLEIVNRQKRAPVSQMTQIICRRNPQLPFCSKAQLVNTIDASVPDLPAEQPTVTETTTSMPTTVLMTTLAEQSTTIIAELDWTPTCKKYQNQFLHYCLNIKSHPAEIQASLHKYCPQYYKYCPEYIRQASEDQTNWFPDIPTATTAAPEPCKWECDAPHCTEACKCAYHWPNMNHICHAPNSGLPLTSGGCDTFGHRCEKFGYVINHEVKKAAQRAAAIKSGQVPEDKLDPHNRNHHAQFWRGPSSSHVDWLHGNFKAGNDWGVPALGIGGTAGASSVKFPSLGTFLGIENPHGPL